MLGLLLAAGTRLPAMTGAALAAVFALFHGAAHGQELAGADAAFAITGIVLASAMLHAAGIGLGLRLRDAHAWLPRAAGATVAVFGMALLGQLA